MQLAVIQKRILEIRGHKVMLDFHLAELYCVETRALKQAVKRNKSRFPSDREITRMVSQNVIPSKSYLCGARPFAFTEQGVAMLSSVLHSPRAVQVNIFVMRAFVLIRQYYLSYKELKQHMKKMEKEMNRKFKDIFEALNYLLDPHQSTKHERRRIGYKQRNEE